MDEEKQASEELSFREPLARREGTDGSAAIDSEPAEGPAAGGQLDAEGTVEQHASGASPQHEEGALNAAARLIGCLNDRGAAWAAPEEWTGPEEGIDIVSRDGEDQLQLQVTRAGVGEEFRRNLGATGEASWAATTATLARVIWSAIEKKRTRASTDIVLLLDASAAPIAALRQSLKDFRQRHPPADVQEVGFKDIWLVGATSEDCVCLSQYDG
jgi:hypothetical protein